jgi:hypothetical protein
MVESENHTIQEPKTPESIPCSNKAFYFILSLFSVACSLPYFLPFTTLPRTEGFDYSVLPTILYAKQLVTGTTSLWEHRIALGIPWPIPHSMTHVPIIILYNWLPVFTVIGIITTIHLFIAGLYTKLLGTRMGFSSKVSTVCAFSVILCPALEYLYKSDAPGVFLTWCMFPVIIYYVEFLLCQRAARKEKLRAAVWLGTAVGYTVLNGHTGVFASYLVAISVFALVRPNPLLRNLKFFSLSIIVFGGISCEKLYFLFGELSKFPDTVQRLQYGLESSLFHLLWGTFLRPFFWVTPPDVTTWKNLLITYISINSFNRTLGFGVTFSVLVFFLSWRYLKNSRIKQLLIVVFICILFMTLPISILPAVFSASWIFRDPANFFGILLAGHIIMQIDALTWQAKLLTTQMFFILAGAIPFICFPFFTEDGYSVAVYNNLSKADSNTEFIHQIKNILGNNKSGRVLFSSTATHQIANEQFIDVGVVNNILPLYGIADITYLTKGISLDTIHPAQSIPYGRITGQRLKQWRISRDTSEDWTTQNDSMLQFIGADIVVTTPEDQVSSSSLTKESELKSHNHDKSLTLYKNNNTLPRALLYNLEILNYIDNKIKHCPPNHLTCCNVNHLISQLLDDSYSTDVVNSNDIIKISLPVSDKPRLLVYTGMYREGWGYTTNRNDSGLTFNTLGLIGVKVPAGVSSVTLSYKPAFRIYLGAYSNLTILLVLLLLFNTLFNQSYRMQKSTGSNTQ